MILHRIISYLRYFFSATNAHGIHSPFVYELYTCLISKQKDYYDFKLLKQYRQSLVKNTKTVELIELGAGAVKAPQKVIVKNIYKSSCHNERDTQLLFKLVDRFQPLYIIELGTCLGVSSLYLAKANTKAKLYTFEGNPDYASIARNAFQQYKANNIQLIEGNIHTTLSPLIESLPRLDMVYIDAHHDYEPTIHFFNLCLSKSHEDTVIIFDDIHWSPAMEKAWAHIKQREEVKQTIDLYQFGIVFLKSSQAKEHFTLRYY